MTRREWLFCLFFGSAVVSLAPQALAATFRFTVNATGSVLSQTTSRLRTNTRSYAWGLMVVALNGQGGNWVYTINGSRVACPAANKTVYKGDVVEWQTI
ncbi:MAG: hypothetical protein WC508_04640 [Patescibacteria group bacterium]